MGNQVSFPCCQAPGDKYEIAYTTAQQDLHNEACAQSPAANVETVDKVGDAKPSVSEKEPNEASSQQTKAVGAFSTSDPLEVAPELAPQQGLPYQFHVCGPPPPPCDDLRLRTINALKTAGSVRMDAEAIDAPPDPEIASILKLVQSIFEAPAALVALFDDRRIFIRDAEGAFKRGDFPWRWSFCGWTMASKNDQIMVIPDATKDARFCNNAMVKSGPGVRFYCGTPLIASNGHRIGTLCFADTKPRDFDASRCVVLNNLAELVVRHLEKDIALQLRAHDNNNLMAAYGNLRRTLDCFDHCVALLDTSTAGWRILFVNNPCCKALGIERESLQGSYLSRLLVAQDGSMMPTDEQQVSADKGAEFQVTARLSGVVVEEMDDKGTTTNQAAATQRFLLTFRPASREDLDGGQIPIGVPNWIPVVAKPADPPADGAEVQPAQRRADTLYFMLLQDAAKLEAERQAAQAKAAAEAKAAAAHSANMSTAHSSLLSVGHSHDRELSMPPESISGLTMGHLLGKGAYGSVYYGTWYGSPVAVKIIDEELPPGAESVAPPIEAILSKELRHPHIVATLRCARRIIGPSGSSHVVSTSTSAALAAARGRGGREGSIDAFSDDTARVSQSQSQVTDAGGGAGGRSGSALGSRINSGAEGGWLGSGLGSRTQVTNSARSASTAAGSHSACTATATAAGGSGGSGSSSSSSAAVQSQPSCGTSTAPAASTPSAADAASVTGVFSTSQVVSAAMTQPQSPIAGGSSAAVDDAAAATALQPGTVAQPGQAGWAIINMTAGGVQVPRRKSSTVAPPVIDGDAGVAAAPATGSEGSTDNSEAYDDFDAGRDSSMSPFLLPPGSNPAAGGMGGPTGLPGHSGPSGASGKWAPDEVLVRHQTWLIMEYCDRGCLQDAIDRGWLRSSPALESSAPRMDAVLSTAVELASALSFLHSKDIVHGDMSAWNVMLCTSGATASAGGRNFVAKIADFGLARHLDIRTKIQTRTYGTLTHMPAETLRDGVISKATDVYSLGVLLWQLFTSSRPWAGLRHGQIIVMVVTQGARLRFPPGCPPAYEDLAMACMEPDPRRRPAIESVLAELESIRKCYM